MRALVHGLAICALGAIVLADAGAAIICIHNKQTGRLEPRGGGEPGDCVRADTRRPIPPTPGAAPAQLSEDPARQQRNYRLKYSDITVRLAMQRWFRDVNMQLAYEAAKDFPVPVEGDYTGSISEVMQQLMNSLSESTYPLRACEYDNRVVLVVHRDEKCALESRE